MWYKWPFNLPFVGSTSDFESNKHNCQCSARPIIFIEFCNSNLFSAKMNSHWDPQYVIVHRREDVRSHLLVSDCRRRRRRRKHHRCMESIHWIGVVVWLRADSLEQVIEVVHLSYCSYKGLLNQNRIPGIVIENINISILVVIHKTIIQFWMYPAHRSSHLTIKVTRDPVVKCPVGNMVLMLLIESV